MNVMRTDPAYLSTTLSKVATDFTDDKLLCHMPLGVIPLLGITRYRSSRCCCLEQVARVHLLRALDPVRVARVARVSCVAFARVALCAYYTVACLFVNSGCMRKAFAFFCS